MTALRHVNRVRASRAGKSLFWCTCDRARVGQYGRCRVCGRREAKGRGKRKG